MSVPSQNDNSVKQVTSTILEQLLGQPKDPANLLASMDTTADLLIEAVFKQGLFKEKNYFNHKIDIINTEDFCESFKHIPRDKSENQIKSFTHYLEQNISKKYEFEVPYEHITNYIYVTDNHLNSTIIEDRLNILAQSIKNKLSNLSNQEVKVLEKVLRKFRRHLLLAVSQKEFILGVAKEADRIAQDADRVSKEASKQAKKAKKISNSMVTNFVTILGIFATIIITVFGGINLIGSAVKLLEGNARLSYLVFVVSFLMICLLTLIRMLTLWLSSINGNEIHETKFHKSRSETDKEVKKNIYKKWLSFPLYTKSILVLGVLLLLSLICISCLPKDEKKSNNSENSKESIYSETRTGININIDSKETDRLKPKIINDNLIHSTFDDEDFSSKK